MSVLPPFSLQRPETIDEALRVISEDAVPYAGGTELLLAMKAGLLRPATLVDVKRITSMSLIEAGTDPILIGGSVTHQQAQRNPGIRSNLPVLAEVLGKVGNPRVRSVGTLGGNLCFAEPKSDVATILIALGAQVVLVSRDGERSVDVEDFVIGPYTTIRRDGEILTEIRVPLGRSRAVYMKYQTMERPTVGVAGSIGSEGEVRVVVGAVSGAPHLFSAERLEDMSSQEISNGVEIIPDLTGSVRYKRHITQLYVDRVLNALETV